MSNRKIISRTVEKIPAHVEIYNMLYSEIINGSYVDGSQLPGENSLAEKYGVSRTTIRLSLAILNEDGLIQKSQGKGTVVTYKGDPQQINGQKISNLIISCSKNEIDMIETFYNYGPPTEIAQKRLGIKNTEIVIACNNIYFSNSERVGHSFIQVPVKFIQNIDINLNSELEVSNLVNKTIFEMAKTARLHFKLISADENITDFLQIQSGEPVIYIEEILFNNLGEGLARCKFYFLPDKYEISLLI